MEQRSQADEGRNPGRPGLVEPLTSNRSGLRGALAARLRRAKRPDGRWRRSCLRWLDALVACDHGIHTRPKYIRPDDETLRWVRARSAVRTGYADPKLTAPDDVGVATSAVYQLGLG